jgi:hypothetical protein
MIPDRPCPHQNTDNNLDVIGQFPIGLPLAPIASATCGRVNTAQQHFFQVVRDFPEATTRIHTSTPAATWWTLRVGDGSFPRANVDEYIRPVIHRKAGDVRR